MKSFIYLIALSTLFFACQSSDTVFSENQDLSPNLEWKRDDVKKFNVKINKDMKGKMSMMFRYAEGYTHKDVTVQVNEKAPDGTEKTFAYTLKVKDQKGDYIGEAGLDIWDMEQVVEPSREFKKGTYTYEVWHAMPNDVLMFSMEIGLKVEEVK